MNDLVSVVMPAYNHEKFIINSIKSVLAQDYYPIEMIIINDGSKDNTHKIIESIIPECEKRFVRFEYRSRSNRGISRTLNEGIKWARSEFVSPIASDDLMKPEKLSTLMRLAQSADKDVGIFFGDAEIINDNGDLISLADSDESVAYGEGYKTFLDYYLRNRPDVIKHNDMFHFDKLISGNFIPGQSAIWRRSAFMDVGLFNPRFFLEDWDMWVRLSKKYKGIYVDKILSSYRWHQSNAVKTRDRDIRLAVHKMLTREYALCRNNVEHEKLLHHMITVNARELVRYGRYDFYWRLLGERSRAALALYDSANVNSQK
jgi:alpha-1,3-rhamnosyltransferase